MQTFKDIAARAINLSPDLLALANEAAERQRSDQLCIAMMTDDDRADYYDAWATSLALDVAGATD